MALQKIAKISVAGSVFEQMKEKLISGEWTSGERIASENVLARQFGVSRLSVRDAIHRLIGMGVLTVRQGDGTYVNDVATGMMQSRLMCQLLLSRPQFEDVIQFRMMLEVGSVELAASRATDAEIAQLRALEEEMRSLQLTSEAFAQRDLEYHNLIAVMSGNSFLVQVLAMIQDVYKDTMRKTIQVRGVEPGRLNHKHITDAIMAHDAQLARTLMHDHIQAVLDAAHQQV